LHIGWLQNRRLAYLMNIYTRRYDMRRAAPTRAFPTMILYQCIMVLFLRDLKRKEVVRPRYPRTCTCTCECRHMAAFLELQFWRDYVQEQSVPMYEQRSKQKDELINGNTCVFYIQVLWGMCSLNKATKGLFTPAKATVVSIMEDLLLDSSRHTILAEEKLLSISTAALVWPVCEWARDAQTFADVMLKLRALVAPTEKVARLDALHDDYLRNVAGLFPTDWHDKKHSAMDNTDQAVYAAIKRYLYSMLYWHGQLGARKRQHKSDPYCMWSKPKAPYLQYYFIMSG